jgi:hypothetical protein
MVFPIVGETLVEAGVFFLVNFLGFLHPDGLVLVQLLHLHGHLLYLLHLLLLFVLGDLDLFFLLLLFLIVIVLNLLLGGLFNLKGNGERDELGVLFDQILEFSLFEEFNVVGLDGEDDLGASANVRSIVLNNGEGSSGSGFPLPLVVVFGRFRDDGDFVSNKEG